MKKSPVICLILFVMFGLKVKAQEKPALKLIATTPLPGFDGDLMHFGVDLKGKRLFLAAEAHKTVEVFDLETGKRIKSIPGFARPRSLEYVMDSNNFIVADGPTQDMGTVELVSGKDYRILKTIKLHRGVNYAVFNPVNKYYYVASGGDEGGANTHFLNIIDTKTFEHVGDITLPGSNTGGMAVDHAGKKLYANLSGTKEVGVVDLDTRQLIARWPVPGAENQSSMALDEPNHRLFIATRKPPKFFVFDTNTGKVVTSLPCSGLNGDMWFDVGRKRIYLTGTETATVLEQRDADHYEHIAEVPTGYRAKTSVFVPKLNRLYVAVSGEGKEDAQLAVQIYIVQSR